MADSTTVNDLVLLQLGIYLKFLVYDYLYVYIIM